VGFTQEDFAFRCGLAKSHFAEVERGESNLTFSDLCQICEILDCDIAALTAGIPRGFPTPPQNGQSRNR
jgi:transcriptional regulator with XRE-family HTH domain